MNANGTLDDQYFEWLYTQVAAARNKNPARSYWELLRQLYTSPYIWFIPNDDNRAEDGKEFRYEFFRDAGIEEVDEYWVSLDCSMLEMLIALSRRISFESYATGADWFWKLLENLDLRRYTDEVYNSMTAEEVIEAIERVNTRTYNRDGTGGLFPLRDTRIDQRKIELWYQMSSYLLENEYVDNGPRT